MNSLLETGKRARAASRVLGCTTTAQRNDALYAVADTLDAHCTDILTENEKDLAAARSNGMTESLQDRLRLTEERIASIAGAVRFVAKLEDPVCRVLGGGSRPNGLKIEKVSVPLGVVGMIYEARPNVTVDAAALCFKAGSACLLRGGKEAMHTSARLAEIMRGALADAGLPADAVNLVEDPSRESANQMMRLNGYLDVLIPRGGAGLIRTVVENASVPVIETGTGNCHVYVDDGADLAMAQRILVNAKCSRPSVCNAAESLLVHAAEAERFLPMAAEGLAAYGVKLHGCPRACAILGRDVIPATEEDWGREYLDFELSVKVVDSLDEAIGHINRYGTGHSEAIVTERYAAAQRFLDEVDAAAVYVNASTRFTDGGEFGFGAEIGISTQKLHARGPMGLEALTSTKYIVYGDGQVR